MGIIRAMRAAFAVVLIAALAQAAPAAASPRLAELVMDARTGEILHQRDADVRLHPASLTKMMTLYLVFEAVQQGRLSLEQRVPVSRAAAAQPPSKIGFRPGQTAMVRDLIRAAAVRSANDAAVVLAEAVSGSEARFAELMTQRARQLGMTSTTFRNASGLTAQGHLSTARDMAVLGQRLFYDYPQYYNLFGRRSTEAFGRNITNTNRLLGEYRGADGIKTGFTRAAGFNLVSSAERNGVRVIASLFGGSSPTARNARVAQLMDLGFQRAGRGGPARQAAPALVASAPAPTASPSSPEPAPRPGDEAVAMAPAAESGGGSLLAAGARALGEALTPSAAQAATVFGDDEVAAARNAVPAPRAPALTMTPEAARRAVMPTPRGGQAVAAVAPTPAAAARPAAAASLAAPGDWSVRLGSFSAQEEAVAELASAALGVMPELAQAGRVIEVARLGGAAMYHARLTGLNGAVATEACNRIRREGRVCEAFGPVAQ